MVDVDVLIIGGGAQGLWLLKDLNEGGFKTILLERRELGCGQTCHSHALIQRGHYYEDPDMMIILNAAAQFWQAFIDQRGIEKLNHDKAIVGVAPGAAVHLHEYYWKTAGLHYEPRHTVPEILEGGEAAHLFETEEFSIDAEQVVRALARKMTECIYKVDDNDEALKFHLEGRKIEGITAVIDGKSYDLSPKITVLCAGENNLALLEKIGAHRNPGAQGPLVQARRKLHMLMIRGEELPPLTAVFPAQGGLEAIRFS